MANVVECPSNQSWWMGGAGGGGGVSSGRPHALPRRGATPRRAPIAHKPTCLFLHNELRAFKQFPLAHAHIVRCSRPDSGASTVGSHIGANHRERLNIKFFTQIANVCVHYVTLYVLRGDFPEKF